MFAVVLLALVGAAPASADPDYAQAGEVAFAQVGKPFVYGATGPNAFDAPGLVLFSYRKIGVNVPRSARAQCTQIGREIQSDELRKGDLICYNNGSHVALYYDEGWMVDARDAEHGVVYEGVIGANAKFRTFRP
ncbi:hypothetical protein GCM10029964_108570 [Kibdelosporangium lantanae]